MSIEKERRSWKGEQENQSQAATANFLVVFFLFLCYPKDCLLRIIEMKTDILFILKENPQKHCGDTVNFRIAEVN